MKAILAIGLLVLAPCLRAAEPESDEATELAKQLSNPVASLISVPFQANYDFNIGPTGDGSRFTLNIQPVVPLSLNKDWNLIIRTILPIVSQHDVFYPALPQNRTQSGLGDTTQSFFLSPKAPGPGGIIWGLGPVALFPTATDDLLGGEKWGLGPTLVLLKQTGGWTYGVLANQIWSVAGDDHRQNISAAFVQPFVTYTTKTHTTFGVNTESTYNWEDEQWTVPINGFISQILKIGKQPVSIQLGGRYYAETPSGGPDWGLRLTFTLLYPQKKRPADVHPTEAYAK
jgi:hypothetical protein